MLFTLLGVKATVYLDLLATSLSLPSILFKADLLQAHQLYQRAGQVSEREKSTPALSSSYLSVADW